jgi:hypothetical protein
MVSLAVAGQVSPARYESKGGSVLRKFAFWYPRQPDRKLDVNEASFTAKDSSIRNYQPLCWATFGLKGALMRALTGLSVTTSFSSLHLIEFHFDKKLAPEKVCNVGRYKPKPTDRVRHFDLNGSGGEVIDKIEVYGQPWATLEATEVYMGNSIVGLAASRVLATMFKRLETDEISCYRFQQIMVDLAFLEWTIRPFPERQ